MYMRLDEFRTAQQGRRKFPLLLALCSVLLLLSTAIFATELVNYSDVYSDFNETFGNDVVIGGVQVGGLNEADRLALLESVYVEQPIVLRYEGSPILLMPAEIGFRLDTDAMQAAATTQVTGDFWSGFWKFLWRDEERSINVPLLANFDQAELRFYLSELALRYDTQGNNAAFETTNYTFSGTSGNTRLDIDSAMTLIEQALFELEPTRRVIELPVITTEGQAASMDDLRQAIVTFIQNDGRISLNGPDTAAAIFVLDLETGEEMGIHENMLMSAYSTIKIGVIINYFRNAITEPVSEVKYKLANAVICSDNGDANTLMEISDPTEGSYITGIRNVNDTMCQVGAVNTTITSRLWIGNEGEGIVPLNYYTIVGVTPCPGKVSPSASVDTSVNTLPDSFNQTTASDMGTMLMQIYDCAIHGSGLRSIFPEEITQTECNYMLEILRGTEFKHFMEIGIPEEVETAHKVGYAGVIGSTTFGDAGIVFSPGGDYVFVMYVWDRIGAGDGRTDIFKWTLIGDVSRIVYNYFNPTQSLPQTRQPVNPLGGAACVMPIRGYEINLNNINENRFDEYGNPIPGIACYDSPNCRPFDNWGRN